MRIVMYDWALDFIGGGQKYACDIAAFLSKKHNVTFILRKPVERGFLEKNYGVDLSGVDFIDLKFRPVSKRIPFGLYNILLRRWNESREIKKIGPLIQDCDLFINCEGSRASLEAPSPKSILICHFPPPDAGLEYKKYRSLIKRVYALPFKSLYNKISLPQRSASYGKILTSSEFAAAWIKKNWKTKAEVLYPGVDIPDKLAFKKENIILSVSRITHKKRIFEMISVFRELAEKRLSNWKFIIAGSIDKQGRGYLEKIKKAAEGFPIEIKTNPGLDSLKNIYSVSKIYWHMTGWGVNETENPEDMEHFGISPVEAMSHGVVPILFNGGGLREIVKDGENGFLTTDSENLKRKTLQLVENPALLSEYSERAYKRSKYFSRNIFRVRFKSLMDGFCDI